MMTKKMVLVNQYDTVVAWLEPTGMFWKVPKADQNEVFSLLDEGDKFEVKMIEIEED